MIGQFEVRETRRSDRWTEAEPRLDSPLRACHGVLHRVPLDVPDQDASSGIVYDGMPRLGQAHNDDAMTTVGPCYALGWLMAVSAPAPDRHSAARARSARRGPHEQQQVYATAL
jgi:hypothetical protein